MATEKTLESWARKVVKKEIGILMFKWCSPSQRGVLDEILFFKATCDIVFVEFKHPNGKGKLSPLQLLTIQRLRDHGVTIYVCDSKTLFTSIIEKHSKLGSEHVHIETE